MIEKINILLARVAVYNTVAVHGMHRIENRGVNVITVVVIFTF